MAWSLQDKVDREVLMLLAALPSCDDGKIIDFAELKGAKSKKKSRYQLFISECLKQKEGPVKERMKACAEEWKKQKNQNK